MAAPRKRRPRSPSEWVDYVLDEAMEIVFSVVVAVIVIWALVSCAWGVIDGA